MFACSVEDYVKICSEGSFATQLKSIVSVNVGSDKSYEPLAVMFSEILENNKAFSDVNLMFEYRLIDHSGFCDLVIIGQKNDIPCVYIVELKEWKDNACEPFRDINGKAVKGKILYHGNNPKRHPAAQVKDYVDSCKKKHSAITGSTTPCNVIGRVFFPCLSDEHLATYTKTPNEKLTEKYPVFNKIEDLAKDILSFIDAPAPEFFKDFSKGTYSQSYDLKSWAENALRTFMNDGEAEKPFDMIGAQGNTYDAVCTALDNAIKDQSKEKKVFIIEGKPGTGKTAVAVNLLLYGLQKTLELNTNYTQNVLFASSSTNEKTWKNTFSGKECKNLMVPASMFNPGMNSTTKNNISQEVDRNEEFKKLELFEEKLSSTGERVFRRDKWREVWQLIRDNKLKSCPCNISSNMYFLTIADEAHSQTKTYIEESDENVTFTTKGVWPEGIGPQAFYVMYTSQISVFLMEDKQGFTDRETTKVEDIKKLAEEDLGVKKENICHFVLTEQYRCGGSCDYIGWMENLLSDSPDMQYKNKIEIKSGNNGEEFWFKNKAEANSFCVQVTDYPSDMENILRSHMGITNSSVRLVSSYSVPWKSNSAAHGTKDISPKAKQELEPHKKDFYLPDRDGKYWSRVWNTAQQFVMPVDNIEMQKDPLCEVGYPQEIRGWDFNHLGILWLDDLLWRNGKWGLRANVTEKRPFSGKKSTEKNPDPEWVGSVLDGGISSCRKKADIELIAIKKDINKAISSLKKELKGLDKTVQGKSKKAQKAKNIDLKYILQQEIQSINESIEKLTAELSAKENELKELLQPDIVICKNDSTPCINALIDKVLNIYRILLTRALKGNVIYVKDPETREHLRELLK